MEKITTLLLCLCLSGCDQEAPPHADGFRSSSEEGPRRRDLSDCRAAYYCFRDCLGGAYLDGASAPDAEPACAERCSPALEVERHHWGWWVSALEQSCEEDWTDECIWEEAVPSLGEGLSGVTLDACLTPRAQS